MATTAGGGITGGTPGHVYLLMEDDGKTLYFKIGCASGDEKNLKKRIADLQTGNPRKLTLVHSERTKDAKSAESYAMKTIKDRSWIDQEGTEKITGGKEWLMVSRRQIDKMKELVTAAAQQFNTKY